MRRSLLACVTVCLVAAPAMAGCTWLGPPASDPGGGPGPPAPAQSPATGCNVTALYDRTIDSVVQVRSADGLGSGFVFETRPNATAYVATNQHVVRGADAVAVRFRDGTYRRGTVVGTDGYADLAVVRVTGVPADAEALPLASRGPEPGQFVAALGSPFGLTGTVTHGIVSGVNRTMPTDRGFTIPNVVQTDAPINPGNSGGPLVTCAGRVVGVNTATLGATRAENLGFAVSAQLVARVVPALIDTGAFEHAFLGVRGRVLTPAVAAANDLETTGGVIVLSTVDGSPAADVLRGSRLRSIRGRTVPVGGDVIVAIDGRPIETVEDLAAFLSLSASPGETVQLTVLRDGERRTVSVTLATRPAAETGPRTPRDRPGVTLSVAGPS